MKQAAVNYGQALFESEVTDEIAKQAKIIYQESSQLQVVLKSPIIDYGKKVRIIDKVFPKEMAIFLKLVCYYHKSEYLEDIFFVYEGLQREKQSVLTAALYYTALPDEAYIVQIKEFLRKKYRKNKVELALVQDLSLISGFMLEVGYMQYDCSAKGALDRLYEKIVRR